MSRGPLLIAALAACRPSPPNVLLVTLDTTRADAIGAYGASPSVTPNLDDLAARGLVFEEAVATVPLTLPAHTSILSGRYPDDHGVRDNLGYRVPGDVALLAEAFDAAGYDTGAFVGAVVLDATFGLDRGFDVYEDGFDLTTTAADPLVVGQWPADVVRGRAAAWLEGRDGPWFLWMHLYDPHRPHTAPEPFASAVADPYAAEVAFADHEVGALLARVDLDRTVVAVIADHGEGNGDHGELTHGQQAWRSTLRVPFVLAGPGVPVGRRSEVVSGVDVAPTLLAAAGLPALPDAVGVDVRGPLPERRVYAETLYPRLQLGLHDLRVLQDDRWRLVEGARAELYAWRDDPGETSDRAGQHGDVVAALRSELTQRQDRDAAAEIGASARAALEALGYLSGDAALPADGPLPDPRDTPDLAVLFEDVIVAARTRPPAEGAVLLQSFVDAHPRLAGARRLLATAHQRAGAPERGLEALAPLVAARPDDAAVRIHEAELLLDAGRPGDAAATLDAVRARDPGNAGATFLLAEIRRREGRCDEARRLADAGLAVAPEASRLWLVRGACALDVGDFASAEVDLRAALRFDPNNPDAHGPLGVALAALGRPEEAVSAFEEQLRRRPDGRWVALLGAARYAAGAYVAAVAPLEDAVAADPNDAESRVLLADALLRGGAPPDRPLALLAEAEALSPSDGRVHTIRSAALMAQGDVEGALEAMRRAAP